METLYRERKITGLEEQVRKYLTASAQFPVPHESEAAVLIPVYRLRKEIRHFDDFLLFSLSQMTNCAIPLMR